VNPSHSSWLPTLIFVPVIGLLLYRRLKGSFGRQKVTPPRMAVRMVLLSAISLLLLVTSPRAAVSYGAGAAGLVLGIVLALIGLAHTTFESSPEGKFYVPNKWLGLLVTALFLGRLAARLFTFSERASEVAAGGAPFDGMQRSPLTLGLFLLLAGYYVTYYAGVMKKAGRAGPAPGGAMPGRSG